MADFDKEELKKQGFSDIQIDEIVKAEIVKLNDDNEVVGWGSREDFEYLRTRPQRQRKLKEYL